MKLNSNILKSVLIYVGIVVFFYVLAYGYVPAALSGKVVNQSDTSGWMGMTHEISQHNATHPDDKTQWTNSMFGGMPTVAMYDEFEGDWLNPIYKAFMHVAARPANFLFISLLGAFLMLLAFGVNVWLAIAGAIAVTFCSYNLQIIQVGHNTKMQAIAFLPWVIAGIVFTYRSALSFLKTTSRQVQNSSNGWKAWLPKTVLGAVLFAIALSFQIKANHVQITYYLAIIIAIYIITIIIWLCVSKDRRRGLGRFFIASALLLVIGGVGITTNLNKLIPTYKYTKYTMRGGSELASETNGGNDKGLDIAYATAWSYGIEETPNLLIPNFNGGASAGELGKNSETYKLLKSANYSNLNNVIKSMPLYWGPQPFTAGPMYLGAITVFLFILGLCLYKGKEKWWLLAATIIAVLLAWGNHFLWFTELWFKHAPMYNKFRTVSMALVVLQFTLPVLGFIVLDNILKNEYDNRSLLRGTGIAFVITAGFCLICTLFPHIAGSFTSSSDAGMQDILVSALAADRQHLLVSDAWRSLVLIILMVLLIYFLFGRKNNFTAPAKTAILAVVVCCLVIFDLWGVGKRYLNNDHFVSKRDITGQFAPRAVDDVIHEDNALDYRVLDISVNTFNDAFPSYHHKNIGGYSPVKLQRYQDLIEKYLTGEINSVIRTVNGASTVAEVQENLPDLPVVSMLNGKYVIIGGNYPPIVNENAFGNAWFVSDFVYADTPDEEIALLGGVDLWNTAIVGNGFKDAISGVASLSSDRNSGIGENDLEAQESDDYIEMTYYAPNELRYHYKTDTDKAVIFSEIFYPEGWSLKATTNSATLGHKNDTSTKSLDLFRADWILRGAVLPAGEGDLVMRFDPPSYKIGATLSRVSSITLILLLLLSLGGFLSLKKQ